MSVSMLSKQTVHIQTKSTYERINWELKSIVSAHLLCERAESINIGKKMENSVNGDRYPASCRKNTNTAMSWKWALKTSHSHSLANASFSVENESIEFIN